MPTLTVFTVATVVMISVIPAGADSIDEAGIPVGADFKRTTLSAPVGNPVSTIPLSKLSATRDRPIFSSSRRPPPPAPPVIARQVEPTKPAEPEQPPLILVGTVAGEDNGIAVFVDQSTDSTVRLRINESHQGWTLGSIQGREVTLVKDRKSSVLALAPPGSGAEPARAQAALEPARRQPRR
jgi:general secretion pathway protein N